MRVNECKSKVVRFSMYVNVGRMDVRLSGEALKDVDCVVTSKSG